MKEKNSYKRRDTLSFPFVFYKGLLFGNRSRITKLLRNKLHKLTSTKVDDNLFIAISDQSAQLTIESLNVKSNSDWATNKCV